MAVAFGSTFLWQFFITWFPTYLRQYRGMTSGGCLVLCQHPVLWRAGGYLGRRRFDGPHRAPDDARGWRASLVGLAALLGGALLMSIGIFSPAARPAALAMALAGAVLDLYLGAAWASATDIGGGGVAGLMNASSNCAGFISPALMGWILDRSANWNFVLLLGVGTCCAAAVFWLFVNPRPQPARMLQSVG